MVDLGINNEQLARACGVKAPTSFHWASGKTKKIKAEPLLLAAKLFGVTPEWLSTGKLPKYAGVIGGIVAGTIAAQETGAVVTALPAAKLDPMTAEMLELFGKLDKIGKAECLGYVRCFVDHRRPHAHGQASALAGK